MGDGLRSRLVGNVPTTPVDVDGVQVWVRALPSNTVNKFVGADGAEWRDHAQEIFQRGVVNRDGTPVFADEDEVEEFFELGSVKSVMILVEAIFDASAVNDDAEDIAGN